MTEEAIVGKLRTELQGRIVSECQVVYILVETRKLLDLHHQAKVFKVLNLYCNWAVHIRLDRAAAQNLIVELNSSYSQLSTREKAHGFKGLWDHLSFGHFRKELQDFLSSHHLPTTICGNIEWQKFLHYYSLVIQDCPLICSAGSRNVGHLHFDKIVLSASIVENVSKAGNYVQITWCLYLRDKLISDLDVHFGSAGSLLGLRHPSQSSGTRRHLR